MQEHSKARPSSAIPVIVRAIMDQAFIWECALFAAALAMSATLKRLKLRDWSQTSPVRAVAAGAA
jgi:hypothetical protein